MSETDISPWQHEDNGHQFWKIKASSLPKSHSNRQDLSGLNKSLVPAHVKNSYQRSIPKIPSKPSKKSQHSKKQVKNNSESAHQLLKKCCLNYLFEDTKMANKTLLKVSNGFPLKRRQGAFQTKMKKQIYYNLAEVSYSRAKQAKKLQTFQSDLRNDQEKGNKSSKRYSEFCSLRKLNLTELQTHVSDNQEQFSDRKIRNSNRDPTKSRRDLAKAAEEECSPTSKASHFPFLQLLREVEGQIKSRRNKFGIKRNG